MNYLTLKCLLLFLISPVRGELKSGLPREVFGFTNFVSESVYTNYDLNKISVLVLLDNQIDQKFVQYLHNNSVRIYFTGKYPVEKLGDNKFRDEWFEKISNDLIKCQINGLNLDFDAAISRDDPKRNQLTDLVKYLKEKLSDRYEFSVSVPWSPVNKHDTATNGQDYDYVQIVNNVDYVLINSFHVNSQIFVNTSEYDDELCIAKSNQGFVEAAAGLLKWLSINDTESRKLNDEDIWNYFSNGLDESNLRNKIIFVYPWFGLDYSCIARAERQRCLIKAVQNFDANCSDKVAKVVKYSEIMRLAIDRKLEFLYDPHSRSTYLEFSDNVNIHQLWFDYYYDFVLKYNYVKQFNLRGMGIYALDHLDYLADDQSKITKYMWGLIPKMK